MNPFNFAIEATLFELQDNPKLRSRYRESKLRSIAWARLRGAGFLKACTRCAGVGYCGPVQVYGGVCFKCGGSGQMIPRFDQKWRDAVMSFDWRKYMAAVHRQPTDPMADAAVGPNGRY